MCGYYCEVHHATGHVRFRTIEVNNLTFGCGPHIAYSNPVAGSSENAPAMTRSGYHRLTLTEAKLRTNYFLAFLKFLCTGDSDEDGETS